MIEIKEILHPTDFSEYAAHALTYAKEFAKAFKAKIILTHVIAVPVYAASYEIAVDLTSLREAIEDAARKKLGEIATQLKAEGIESQSCIEFGNSFVEIIAVAKRENADLIIMGTHGLGAFKHLLLGSTAERVVRKAPCPVLTVRNPEHEFIHP